jgi:hypothetical protein
MKLFSNLRRCHALLVPIVNDIVFHIGRKINDFILFKIFILSDPDDDLVCDDQSERINHHILSMVHICRS